VSLEDPARNESVIALLLGEFPDDRVLVHDVFRDQAWRLLEARDRRSALQYLNRHPVHVVIAEANVPGWDWKSVLSHLRILPRPPQLIVTSRMADDYLWAEVLNCGGYDVLAQPFDREEVERVVAAARRHFESKPAGSVRAEARVAGAA
jgi:DNA-binding response OmpR family regulator